MSDAAPEPTETETRPEPGADVDRNPLRRSPKLQILLIAGVFYAILIGMFLFVMVLIIRG